MSKPNKNASPAAREQMIQQWWSEANALYAQGVIDQAGALYQRILQEAPGQPQALNALGICCVDMGRNIEALQLFNHAAKQDPTDTHAYLNMGHLLSLMERFDSAAACYRQALSFAPDDKNIKHSLAKMLASGNQPEEALALYTELLQSAPQDDLLLREKCNVSPIIFSDNAAIDRWREAFQAAVKNLPVLDIARHLPELEQANVRLNFNVIYHGRDNLALKREYYRRFTSSYMTYFAPSATPQLRVGFHVDQFREGVFLRVMGNMLKHWPAKDITPVVLCPIGIAALLHERINNPDVQIVALPKSLSGMAEVARAQSLDLIYFWEVGTSVTGTFLPMLRLAPVQVTGWGSVESTGVQEIDYFLSSRGQEKGDTQQHYSEKLVLLDHLPAQYEKRLPQTQEDVRSALNLPPKAHLYFCPQMGRKFHPDFDAAIAEILQKDGNAFFIFTGPNTKAIAEALHERVKARAGKHADRVMMLHFLEIDQYMRLLEQADVVLDTFYYCGGQTTLDAIAVGAPVITLPGNTMKSRSTAAAYEAIGITDTIAKDAKDYVNKAVALAGDAKARDVLRTRTLAAHAPLFDNPISAEEHIAFFREAIAQYRKETGAKDAPQPRVLSVGGNDILTHPLPAHYTRFQQEALDIDPRTKAAIICDARELTTLPPAAYDAIYCSHNLEHYFAHDVPRVLKGFLHLLKPHGFAELWVPDMQAVMKHVAEKGLDIDDVLYTAHCGPILVKDVMYGYGKEIAESGQDFYAHKTGFSERSLLARVKEAGFAHAIPIQRGAGFEVGVLAFKTMPDAARRKQFGGLILK